MKIALVNQNENYNLCKSCCDFKFQTIRKAIEISCKHQTASSQVIHDIALKQCNFGQLLRLCSIRMQSNTFEYSTSITHITYFNLWILMYRTLDRMLAMCFNLYIQFAINIIELYKMVCRCMKFVLCNVYMTAPCVLICQHKRIEQQESNLCKEIFQCG